MNPRKLTLRGFTGIKSGTGRDEVEVDLASIPEADALIAIVGPNGAGKTTLTDNLHPYRLMPSRATAYSPNAFSFWDHIYGPEAAKELEWESVDGDIYNSTLIFRSSGKTKKSEAYLHKLENGAWVTVSLPDGTVSDGKTETYDRCIEHLLGSPEMFFTSAFTAQNKRPLSSYTNAEIKALMAELLGIEKLREIGKSASAVVKALQARLADVRGVLQQAESLNEVLHAKRIELVACQDSLMAHQSRRSSLQELVQSAQEKLAAIKARLDAFAESKARKTALIQQKADATQQFVEQEAQMKEDIRHELSRQHSIRSSITQANSEHQVSRVNLENQLARSEKLLAERDAIVSAAQQVAVLQSQSAEMAAQVSTARNVVRVWSDLQASIRAKQSELDAITKDGSHAGEVVQSLKSRVIMIEQVPCAGQSMQATCPLMKDALDASRQLPEKEQTIDKVRQRFRDCRTELETLQAQAAEMGDVEQALHLAEQAYNQHVANLNALSVQASLASQLADAEANVTACRDQLAAAQLQLDARIAAFNADLGTIEKRVADLDARKVAMHEDAVKHLSQMQSAIDAIPDDTMLEQQRVDADTQLQQANRDLADVDTLIATVLGNQARLQANIETMEAQLADAEPSRLLAGRLTDEIAMYTLLAKAFGNDGIVALSIDDAGPALASITNDLLLNCYGPRFSVSIVTQEQKANGDMKEGFDVMVFDGERAESKSLAVMSGGERVWLNECLIRAIAIYQSKNGGNRFSALFSDEADGPLDPERKKHFMKMKREVMRVGGYRREFFISQSPELWEMADTVLNMASL